jgi:hypothetical protein
MGKGEPDGSESSTRRKLIRAPCWPSGELVITACDTRPAEVKIDMRFVFVEKPSREKLERAEMERNERVTLGNEIRFERAYLPR